MKRFLVNNWEILILILLSGLIVWPLFIPGYFSHHDDLQVMRIFEMRKCFADLQFPCRWVPDMGYGNGYPLFNFYNPFIYYLGALFSYVVGYVISAKMLFFIPLVFGGIAMYLLSRELFGLPAGKAGKVPGIVSAILFMFAPYRALDVYVRGDIAESFAIALVPFVLFLIFKLITTGNNKYFLLGTLSLFAFFLSHNIMTLIFTPVIFAATFLFLYKSKWENWKKIVWFFVLAAGMSAFFVLPAFFEKNLIQIGSLTTGELDFRAQFVKISQLFIDRSWNYGASMPQSSNTISYQIGWPHWWLVIFSIVMVAINKKRKGLMLFVLLLTLFVLSVFMTHNQSAFVWEKIKILSFVQFPWRFLSIAIFSASLIGGYFVSLFKGKYLYILASIILVSTVLLNWKYFRPEHFYPNVTDTNKLSGQAFIDQQKGALLDYLPKTAAEPRELAPEDPQVVNGDANINNFVNKSNGFKFNVDTNEKSTVDIPVFYFPNWKVFANNEEIPVNISKPAGRIEIILPKGDYEISGVFANTKTRSFANAISIISFLGFVGVAIYGKNTKLFT